MPTCSCNQTTCACGTTDAACMADMIGALATILVESDPSLTDYRKVAQNVHIMAQSVIGAWPEHFAHARVASHD